MAVDFKLSEGLIRQHSARDSFQRRREYYRAGAVRSLVRRGGVIEAEVEGSRPWPYQVCISFDSGGVTSTDCTCPYDWGGWCKHVVAALPTCLHEPSTIEEREPLETRLASLTGEQLREVLLGMAGRDPSLTDALERQLDLLSCGFPQGATSRTKSRRTVDGRLIRRAVRDVLRSLDRMRPSEAYWQVGAVVDGVRKILDLAQERLAAGDGGALTVLEAVTEAYLTEWEGLDDSAGEASAFFEDLANSWLEAPVVMVPSSAIRVTPDNCRAAWTKARASAMSCERREEVRAANLFLTSEERWILQAHSPLGVASLTSQLALGVPEVCSSDLGPRPVPGRWR